MNGDFEPWNKGMDMPLGKPRPRFVGETDQDRISGSGTIEDPELVWLGAIPSDTITREANEDIVRKAARSLETVTNVYIRCAVQSTMYVDRNGKRIHIWNPDRINFRNRTRRTDPHIAVAFGTTPDNLVLYGFIHVAIDENGKPVDFAAYRDNKYVLDGDDRVFELFKYNADQRDCGPYCPSHARQEVLIDSCELAMPAGCPLHNTEGLLDHFCFRARWKTEGYCDHYCPCLHDTSESMDHYCPCPHDQVRLMVDLPHCPHMMPKKERPAHYCPSYIF
ncbi:hypothetical protein F4813DRAFT_399882 [Daldinia decipiens]|uniref:uncharacterized protein n=1 Tax=Daldinia decipiens TaxID=326647 RepID=UPI0020C38A69|nr:uncharacterized protein F4813DRAFT_399882 [Daldinia decipiens]KAI1653487.1 hypothetical protein F4813DRAFT_399882 [Daldinia decipiens]